MGIKNIIKGAVGKAAGKAGNAVSKLSALSPSQLEEVEERRARYLEEMPSSDDATAVEQTSRLIAAAGVEIYAAYLPQIGSIYLPLTASAEYDGPFDAARNIRFLNITKWVSDPEENSLEKLVNVYDVLSNERCNIALVFHRTKLTTEAYLAVVNTENADNNVDADSFVRRLEEALRGNFPGSECSGGVGSGTLPCLRGLGEVSVATVSNVPTEKSEKFVSQTIEKLLDGIVPRSHREEYTLILLATPTLDVEERKLRLEQLYTGLAPYSSWQTQYTYQESSAQGSSATVGVNAGLSIGSQQGNNQSLSDGEALAESESRGVTDTKGDSRQTTESSTEATSTSHTDSKSESSGDSDSVNVGLHGGVSIPKTPLEVGGGVGYGHSWNRSTGKSESDTLTRGMTKGLSETVGRTTSRALSNTLGRSVTRSLTNTVGSFASTNLGGNFGVNFARSSTVTATIGKNEGITQTHTNYAIKHALELLEKQMTRLEQGTALGLWDFAAYFLCEDVVTANNVAHSYLALTQGEESFMSQASVNVWRGDVPDNHAAATICGYLTDLRHPVFGLNPDIVEGQPNVLPYPAAVTATTILTGKELARSLNFPSKSVTGLPVFECASFGRNVSIFDERTRGKSVRLGSIFHMHREEPTPVLLDMDSLASHVFVTGSTGAGKSNAVYRLLEGVAQEGVGFLVVEPAKGEYKDVFGADAGVRVYGTNPEYAPLLRLNPFSFPAGMHVLEHLDRLVEIFNVCWPMYAAMPAVLKSAIEKSYEDCGWNLGESKNPYGDGLYPRFADVARNVREIIDSSEYDAENKGAYKGSLLTRLSSLSSGINGMVFSSDETDQADLFDGRTVVDLSRVGSSETKSLLMGILVLKLQERRMTQGIAHNAGLRHVTVLEEAHNLLRKTSTEQPVEGGNLLGKSVEMLSNAIAEMRTYGEGFIIADQAPGLLDTSVIRNTNTKIVMRLPDGSDRQLVGGAEALTEAQTTELARLPRGVAAVYQNDWIEAVLCKIDKAEHGGGRYEYVREGQIRQDEARDVDAALEIAGLLSRCERISDEARLSDIREKMDRLGIDATTKVAILKLLAEPPKKPRMTRLAPIMSALFPEVRTAAVEAIASGNEMHEWTERVRQVLYALTRRMERDQLERDIVQSIFVECLLIEQGDIQKLERWTTEGGLW